MLDTAQARRTPTPGAIRLGAAWGAVTGALVAIIDVTDTALAGFDGSIGYLAWYTASALILGFGVLGGALGAWTRAVGWALPGASRGWRAWIRAVLLGLPGGIFVAWVPTSWITEHWATLTARGRAVAWAVYVLAFIGSTLVAWIAERARARWQAARPVLPRWHLIVLALAALVAVSSYWADRRILVDLYEDFHYGLAGTFVASLGLLTILLSVTPGVRWPALARRAGHNALRGALAIALGGALASLCVLEQLSPDVFGPSSSVIFSKLVGTVRSWSDFDRDGASNLLGGSDCEPFDASALPGQFDMPGNGIDEDCSGTSAEWPKPEPEPTYPVPDASGYNVLLISVDALRADHVGAYGYTAHPTTPNVDRLAQRSIKFTEAFSPAPKTYDALPSLATGLYPSNVPRDYRVKTVDGRKKPYLYRITDDVTLLSEVLQKRGYVTGAAHVGILRSLGLNRGIDEYQLTRAASDMALDFLQRRVVQAPKRQPFYLWLHYYSPHHTYEKRPGFDFGDADVDRYDSEIAHDDAQIGRVLDALDELGLAARTVVIFTADHGEEFRDHGGTQHSLRLYRELTRVPLLLAIPGVEPRTVDVPVELADVAPTICQLLRLGSACGEHDGHSLIAAVEGKRHPERGAYSELYRKGDLLLMNALSTGKWRLIYDYNKDRAQLYDLEKDRTEQHNVARQHPELVQALRDRMATRTLYRQGQIFQRYVETKDSLVLARALPVFRRAQMLELALDRIEEDVSGRHVKYLKKLLKRSGLQPHLKKRTKQLIERAGGQAKQAS